MSEGVMLLPPRTSVKSWWRPDEQEMTSRWPTGARCPQVLPLLSRHTYHNIEYSSYFSMSECRFPSLLQSTYMKSYLYHISAAEKTYDIQIFTDECYFLLSLYGLKLPSFYSVRCAVVTIVWAGHRSWTHQMRLWELTQIPASASAGCCTGSTVRDNLWSL